MDAMAKGASILLVEDNEKNRELARELLSGAGYRVIEAAGVDAARAELHAGLPDLILLDIHLPGEEGTALLEDLRFLPGGQGVPVIAWTAYNQRGDETQLLAGGCDGFIGKPHSAEKFLSVVRQFLAEGRAKPRA